MRQAEKTDLVESMGVGNMVVYVVGDVPSSPQVAESAAPRRPDGRLSSRGGRVNYQGAVRAGQQVDDDSRYAAWPHG